MDGNAESRHDGGSEVHLFLRLVLFGIGEIWQEWLASSVVQELTLHISGDRKCDYRMFFPKQHEKKRETSGEIMAGKEVETVEVQKHSVPAPDETQSRRNSGKTSFFFVLLEAFGVWKVRFPATLSYTTV